MTRLGQAIAPLILSIGLAGCNPFAEDWEWNQKLTVEVATPEGIRSGSAITHVRWREADVFGNYHAKFSGEATVVDLGAGRYLFALIGEATEQIAAYTLHAELGEQRSDYDKLFPKIVEFRGTREVPRDRYPLLVTFDDVDNPATISRVDPANLSASFGAGISLHRISLEITSDGEEHGDRLEHLLKWLNWPRDRFLAAGGGETPLKVPGQTIGRTSFRR